MRSVQICVQTVFPRSIPITSDSDAYHRHARARTAEFDPKTFLSVINDGRKLVDFAKKEMIFRQGHQSDAVFYLPVLSADGVAGDGLYYQAISRTQQPVDSGRFRRPNFNPAIGGSGGVKMK